MTNLSPRRVLERKTSKLYQNSYRLIPKRKFNSRIIKEKIKHIINSHLEEFEYSEQIMHDLVNTLLEEIKEAIKEERYDRCRLIVWITAGQKKMQGLSLAHNFLWDHERDYFTDYTHEDFNFFINVVVYGVYYD